MDTITRRRFLDRTGTYALGGLSAGLLPGLVPRQASAQRTTAPSGPREAWLALTPEAAILSLIHI